MRAHQIGQAQPREGYPWFRIKAGDTVYHLRIPSIATASSIAAYYSGVLIATQNATEAAQKAAAGADDGETLEAAKDASEHLVRAQNEMYGALGFVLLSCWRDPAVELVSKSAWQESFEIRKAIKAGASLERFDDAIVAAVRDALSLIRQHQTDLKTAFGLLAWDEMVESGLSHEAIQHIATQCSRLVFDSIKSKSGSGVELIADF